MLKKTAFKVTERGHIIKRFLQAPPSMTVKAQALKSCRSRLYRLQAVWSSAAHLSFLNLSFPIQERERLTLLLKRSIDIKLPEM